MRYETDLKPLSGYRLDRVSKSSLWLAQLRGQDQSKHADPDVGCQC